MHQRKILLLENVATQAAGVREQLSQAGFQVAVSRYEADGLKRLAEWTPDLVLVSTTHPAGDFVEYCRRVRAIAPAARIIVTASLNRDRLFQKHPGLQTIVDGVLLRPYAHDEIAAVLAAAPVAPRLPDAAPVPGTGNEELRAEFQRQLDARFLEVEELKRRLEVASKRVAPDPGQGRLQSENEHLRQGLADAQKKAALALATEQLKRSEIEVKLDNLLRMKEDFEFRAQNKIEEQDRELDLVRAQLQELRESSAKAAGEHAALRVEMESALIEKEQVEERLQALATGKTEEAAPADARQADEERIAALEDELTRQRALAAEGQVALADLAVQAAVLEGIQAREPAAREEREQLLAQIQGLREQAATAQRLAAELQGRHDGLQDRLAAAESAAAAAQTELAAASERRAALEKLLAEEQEARAGDARLAQEHRDEAAAQKQQLLARAAAAEQRTQLVQAACTGLEERLGASEAARIAVAAEAETVVEEAAARGTALAAELERERAARADAEQRASDLSTRLEAAEPLAAAAAALRARAEGLDEEVERLRASRAEAGERTRELAAERDRLQGLLEEQQQALGGEVSAWREKDAAAARELELLRLQQEQLAGGQEEERRRRAEQLEQAVREREESERRVAALRGELAAAAEAHERETRLLKEQVAAAAAAAREAGGRVEIADAALIAAREGFAAREREVRLQMEAQQVASRELEEKLAAQAVPEAGAGPLQAELRRIQELLEEVISRARTEAVDYARRDAELSTRLQAALDERRLLQERFDRASVEATERERRSSSLLQSAIDHGPARLAERANLPAVVPLDSSPGTPRRKHILAGLAVVTLAVLLAFFGLHRTTPPVVHEQQPAVPRPQPGASPGAATTPREVWERWTRSDGSGGVLVQATLRSRQELLAEVEADRSRGLSEEEVGAELARRLSAFRFDTTYYVTVYLKNLAAGYPAYLDDLPGRFRLRDSSGKEVPAFLPPGHEKDRRIYSFGAGAPGDLMYEASISLGFERAGLSPAASYLQLVVSDVGAASRRVLTWELE